MNALPLRRAISLAIVVALGVAAAWASAISLPLAAYTESRFKTLVVERLYVSATGAPLIQRQTASGNGRLELLSLDRQPVDRATTGPLIYPGSSSVNTTPSAMTGFQWHNRLVSDADRAKPQNYWYLLHEGRANGRAYGMGFNSATNRPSGYFSREGFSDTLPPRESWFQVLGPGGLATATFSPSGIPSWNQALGMILLADGKLWIIDVDDRTVRPIIEAPGAIAVSSIQRAYASLEEAQRDDSNTEKRERQWGLVRFPESCTVVDFESGKATHYPLPDSLRSAVFNAVQLSDDRLLLAAEASFEHDTRLVWLDPSGVINEERTVKLDNPAASTPASVSWLALLIAPAPLVSYWIALWLPSQFLRLMGDATYAQALTEFAPQLWPPVLLITVISLALAILAYRRQKSFGLPRAAAWAVFCFVLGVPGWLAYRFLWPWPPVGACPSCEHQTPLDRPACLDCGRSFPPPRLTGGEVFA